MKKMLDTGVNSSKNKIKIPDSCSANADIESVSASAQPTASKESKIS